MPVYHSVEEKFQWDSIPVATLISVATKTIAFLSIWGIEEGYFRRCAGRQTPHRYLGVELSATLVPD
jgi:hypothetical protein